MKFDSVYYFIGIGVIFYLALVFFCQLTSHDNYGRLNLYLQVGTLTIFVINLLLTLENYRQQLDDRRKSYYLKYGNISQMKLNDIDKMFFTTPILTRLYLEMYQNDPHIIKIRRQTKPIKETAEILKAEHHASSIIFQTMADIYIAGMVDRNGEFDCEDLIEWYNTFIKWLNSSILRSHWQTLKDEYHPKFVIFIEQLLKSSLQNSPYSRCYNYLIHNRHLKQIKKMK